MTSGCQPPCHRGFAPSAVAIRVTALVVAVTLLTSCQLYWTKPGADLAAFTADHRECATKAGVPMDGDRLLVTESLYKACLKALGWRRETGSSHDGAEGGCGCHSIRSRAIVAEGGIIFSPISAPQRSPGE